MYTYIYIIYMYKIYTHIHTDIPECISSGGESTSSDLNALIGRCTVSSSCSQFSPPLPMHLDLDK